MLDVAEDRDRRGAAAVHRLRDAFTLERIHQTGGVADQQNSTTGRVRTNESHLQPRADGTRLQPRRIARGENSDARRVLNEGVEVARGAPARAPVGEHTDPEPDIRSAVSRRKGPSVPWEAR